MKPTSVQWFSSPVVAVLILIGLSLAGFAQAQTYTVLDNLGTNSSDPINPTGPVTQGRDGNLYGGGHLNQSIGSDQIFKVTPSGTITVLTTFTTSDNGTCGNGLTLGTDGNFYGVCRFGDGNFLGYVYKMTPAGVLTVLHNFTGVSPEGWQPSGPPIQGGDGNFYGATSAGGVGSYGTIYKLTPTGTLTTLWGFTRGADGATPTTDLIQGNDGNFYGGTVTSLFRITASGKLTPLHDFNGVSDGSNAATLVQGADGNLYGTTYSGGANNFGTFFKVTANGAYTVVHDFSSADGGRGTGDSLVLGTDGNFYGAEVNGSGGDLGTLYKITRTGTVTVLHSFGGADGSVPRGGMVQHTGGVLFGDTNVGGSTSLGVIYDLNVNLGPFVSLVTISGKETAKIGILGQGFSAASVVKFGGVQATTVTRTGTTFLLATVPAAALTGSVTVATGATTLTSIRMFKVKPIFTTFAPPSGPVGTSVTITGTGLKQTTKVTFNGTVSLFTVNSDAQVTATVPMGATTGVIQVTTKGGVVGNAISFTVN